MKKTILRLALFLLTATVTLLTTALAQTPVSQPFSDINQYSKYYRAAVELKNRGVIQGYEDGSFKPDQKVNRAETLKILLLGSGITLIPEHGLPFPDTGSGSWYGDYVQTALDLSYVQGYPDGSFKPGQTINKVESLKMLTKINKTDLPVITDSEKALFQDTPLTAETMWYQPYVFYATQTNILDPKNIFTFDPAGSMTRGELIETMYRLVTLREASQLAFDTSQSGQASFYGGGIEGKKVASGETFSNDEFSTAHTFWPFGMFMEVINTNNGVSTVVRVNDRGPYVDGRVADLSQSAFDAIENFSRGLANVKIRPIGVIPGLDKSYIDTDAFSDGLSSNLSVMLDHKIPNLFYQNEVYTITGSTQANVESVTALLTDKKTKKQIPFEGSLQNGRFTIPVLFENGGSYTLNIIPGTVGVGYADLQVMSEDYFAHKIFLPNTNPPREPRFDFQDSKTTLMWDKNGNNMFRLHFRQGGTEKIFWVGNQNNFQIPYGSFSDFAEKPLTVLVEGARSSTDFSVDRYTEWAQASALSFTAARHEYEIYKKDQLVLHPFSSFLSDTTLHIEGTAKVTLEKEVWYITPSGKTVSIDITQNPTLAANQSFAFDVPIAETGTYLVEINDTKGEAVFNFPFYREGSYPLVPNPRDVRNNFVAVKTLELAKEREKMLSDINAERSRLGLSPYQFESKLNSLAQSRSDDMLKRNYFAHVTPEGKTVNDLKTEYGVSGAIGENLARDINPALALYGLFRSAGHRNILISESFTRIGIGMVKANDGSLLITQVFN